MGLTRRIVFLITVVSFISISGCATLPKSTHSLEMERAVQTSFDKTWDGVLEVIKMSGGVIITEDKPSGLIVYTVSEGKGKANVYMTVYIKRYKTTDTVVYLTAKYKSGFYSGEIDKDFFEILEKVLGGK